MDNIADAVPNRAHRTPSRRAVLGGLIAGSLLTLSRRGARAAFIVPGALPRPIRFDIVRAGDVIGNHEVDFALNDGALSATTRIAVEVSVLGVKLFEFHHRGTEIWADGRLQMFNSETLDGDSTFFVAGRATTDGFQMTNRKGIETAPADIMVGSYWTPQIARETLLIDPQRGQLKEQRLLRTDRTEIRVASAPVEATRYTLSGLTDGWVAYDDGGGWIGAVLKKKDSDIQYRLRS